MTPNTTTPVLGVCLFPILKTFPSTIGRFRLGGNVSNSEIETARHDVEMSSKDLRDARTSVMNHALLRPKDTVPPYGEISDMDMDRETDDKVESAQKQTPKRKKYARSETAKAKRRTDDAKAKQRTEDAHAKRSEVEAKPGPQRSTRLQKRTTDDAKAKQRTDDAHAKRTEVEAKPSPQKTKRLLRHAECEAKARNKRKATGGPAFNVFKCLDAERQAKAMEKIRATALQQSELAGVGVRLRRRDNDRNTANDIADEEARHEELFFIDLLTKSTPYTAEERARVVKKYMKNVDAMMCFMSMLTTQGLDDKLTLEEILGEHAMGVSVEDQEKASTAFMKVADPSSRLIACAACGVRDFVAHCETNHFNLTTHEDKLHIFEYLDHQQLHFNDCSRTYQRLKSSVLWGSKRYHLHQELVDTRGNVVFCDHCALCVTAKERSTPPKLSVASGVDFGYTARLNLPKLSVVEKCIVQLFRVYSITVKCDIPAGVREEDFHTYRLRGHVTGMRNDGPVAVVPALIESISTASSQISITFLGTQSLMRSAFQAGKFASLLRADASRIIRHLHVYCDKDIRTDYQQLQLSLLAPAFAQLDAGDPLTSDNIPAILTTALQTVVEQIVAGAECADDGNEARRLRAVDGLNHDDISNIRVHDSGSDEDLNFEMISMTENESALGKYSTEDAVTHTILKVLKPGPHTAVGSATFENTDPVNPFEPVEPSPPPSGPSRNTIVAQIRQGVIINEFSDNRSYLAGAFPWVFMFGGAGSFAKEGSQATSVTRHVALQFTNAAAEEQQLILLLANQAQRHAACSLTSVKLKNDPESVEAFLKMTEDAEFNRRLELAQGGSNSDADYICKRVMKYLDTPGNRIPHGPMQRRACVRKIYSLVYFLGLPSVFWTISPDDVHESLSIRLCFPSTTGAPGVFPHTATKDFVDAFEKGANFSQVDVPGYETVVIKLDTPSLTAYISNNPIAAAEIYNRTINAVFAHLLGTPDHKSKNVKSTKDPMASAGLFGKPFGSFGVTEIQGRGSLHCHMLHWNMYNATVLQRAATDPEFAAKISSAIETMFTAEIPRKFHLHKKINEANNAMRPSHSPFVFPERQSRVPWPTVPMFDKADAQGVRRMNEEWSDRAYKAAVNVCVHNHRPSCRKLPSGLMRCRFSMPCPECQRTNAVQIRLQPNMTPRTVEVISDVSKISVDCGKDRDFFQYPTTKRDKRVIIWDVVRRIMPDLLSDADAVSDEHHLRETVRNSVLSLIVSGEELDRILGDDDDSMEIASDSTTIRTLFQSSLPELLQNLQLALNGSAEALAGHLRGDSVDLVATRELWTKVRADLIVNLCGVKSVDLKPFTPEQIRALLNFSSCLEAVICSLDVELFGDDLSAMFQDIRNRESKSWIWLSKVLPLQNLLVSGFNRIAMALLPSNQCAVLMGGSSQAASIIPYVAKYCGKDSNPIAKMASCLLMAREHNEKYVSGADNSGTRPRTALHLMQGILNRISALMEMSSTQAATLILGYGADFSSFNFTTVFVNAAMDFVESYHKSKPEFGRFRRGTPSTVVVGEDDDHQDFVYAGSDEEQDLPAEGAGSFLDLPGGECVFDGDIRKRVFDHDRTKDGEVCHDKSTQAVHTTSPGQGLIYTDDEGLTYVVSQHDNYAYRGPKLRHVCLYTYVQWVKIVKKKEPKPGATVTRGADLRIPFAVGHKLYHSHEQQLVSKMFIPQPLAVPPSFSGVETGAVPDRQSKTWKANAHKISQYYLTLFRPWELRRQEGTGKLSVVDQFGLPIITNYAEFCVFMKRIQSGEGNQQASNYDRTIHGIITTMSKGLLVTKDQHAAQCAHRSRNTTVWDAVRPEGFSDGLELPPGRKTGGVFNSDRVPNGLAKARQEEGSLELQAAHAAAEAEQAAKDLSDINAMALKQTRSLTNEQTEKERAQESANNHGRLMDSTPEHPSYFKSTGVIGSELRIDKNVILRKSKAVGAPDETIDIHWAGQGDSTSTTSGELSPVTDEQLLALKVYGKTLNVEQNKQMIPLIQYLRRDVHSQSSQPRLIVHGPGGSGKTHFILHLLEIAKRLGQGVSTGAAQASAASNIIGGSTIHSMLTLRFKSDDDSDKEQELVALSFDQVTALRKRFGLDGNSVRPRVRIVVIDEISQINPFILSCINSRLQEIFQSQEEFGGVAVILLGDFFQMRPVMGDSLAHAVVSAPKSNATTSNLTGRTLFQQFTIGCFTAEERAKGDQIWAQFTRKVRDHGKILKEDLHHIKVLTPDEANSDWRWFFAPVVCGSNSQRHEINAAQAVRFAKRAGKPVIKWCNTFVAEKFGTAKITNELRNSLYVKDHRFTTLFVEGAPGYINKNMTADATMKGICNGTPCKMHSLTFSSDVSLQQQVMETRLQIENAKPGEVVVIMLQPLSINVELSLDTVPDDPQDEPALLMPLQFRQRLLQDEETLVPDRLVIPILQTRSNKGQIVRIEGRRGEVVSGKITQNVFEVELGFAMTYHKAQGRTIPRLIVDLNKTTQSPFLLYEVLYVAITRVQRGEHLRCLPSRTGDFDHLLKLAVRKTTLDWLYGFDDTGFWTVERAMSRKQPKGDAPQVPFGFRDPPARKIPGKVQSRTKPVKPLITSLYLWGEYFESIISGTKKVEGRIAYNNVSNIRVNHLIRFSDRANRSRAEVIVKVTAIRHYCTTLPDSRDPLDQFLQTETLSQCCPGKSTEQAHSDYRRMANLPAAKERIRTHGFFAFQIEVVEVGGVSRPPPPITPTFIPELAPSRKRPEQSKASQPATAPARAPPRAATASAASLKALAAAQHKLNRSQSSYHEQMRAALRISRDYQQRTRDADDQFDRDTKAMMTESLNSGGGQSNAIKVDKYLLSLHKTRLKVLGDGNCGIYSLFLSFNPERDNVSSDEAVLFRKNLTDYGRQHSQDEDLVRFWTDFGGVTHYREYDKRSDKVTLSEHYRVGGFITEDKNWIGLMEILICARMLARDIITYSVIDDVTGDNHPNCRYSTRDWDSNAIKTGLPPLEIAAVNRNHYDCVRPALMTISSEDEDPTPARAPRPKLYDMTGFQYDEGTTMYTDLENRTRRRELSHAELSLTNSALTVGGASIVNTRFGIAVTCEKLRCLDGTTWLNDEVINYYFKLIEKRSYQHGSPKTVKVLSTFFYRQMTDFGYSHNATIGRTGLNNRRGHVFKEINILMFPVHVGYVRKQMTCSSYLLTSVLPLVRVQTHWVLIVVDFDVSAYPHSVHNRK